MGWYQRRVHGGPVSNWIPLFRRSHSQLFTMADVEKKKKKKKKEEVAEVAPEPEAAPAPAPAKSSTKASSGSKKKQEVQRSGSNVFSMFSQKQVAEFKEGFQLMDRDKDGILSKNDLRATFDEMVNDAPGPINFTMLLTMFAERQSGGSDEDDVVIGAFKSFDDGEGNIDGETLRHALMTWGDRFSSKEVDDAYESMTIDGAGKIDCQKLIEMLTAAPVEEDAKTLKSLTNSNLVEINCSFSTCHSYVIYSLFLSFYFSCMEPFDLVGQCLRCGGSLR